MIQLHGRGAPAVSMLEFAACYARRSGGVVGLGRGLIGPDDAPRTYTGQLSGTPPFSEGVTSIPHIPGEWVRLSGKALRRIGGEVTMRLYPGMEHTINSVAKHDQSMMSPVAAWKGDRVVAEHLFWAITTT
jgi:phospholipase/carboxylesterase